MTEGSLHGAKHVPRKRFGQNFLVSPGVVAKILAAIAPQPDDTLVEIGPGLGALTAPLLDRLKHLQVVEIDRDLIARLKRDYPGDKLTIHQGDALQFDFAALGERLRILRNLPYNIHAAAVPSRPLCRPRMTCISCCKRKWWIAWFAPGGPEYGRLSVMQYRHAMERLFLVPPGAFEPAPKVASAIVRMLPLPANALAARDESLFARVVTAAFGQRRKMLRNTLRELIGEADLAALNIKPTARAEELGVADYIRIADALAA